MQSAGGMGNIPQDMEVDEASRAPESPGAPKGGEI